MFQTAAIFSYNLFCAKWHIQSSHLPWDYPATLTDTTTAVSQGGITKSIVRINLRGRDGEWSGRNKKQFLVSVKNIHMIIDDMGNTFYITGTCGKFTSQW